MVLACVTMLLLALMLMLSFNLSNAIHEKIRIQAHADAQAYSVALIEARAYNTLAYSNRAIAAAFVAQIGLHAWLAIASQTAAIHRGFVQSFMIITGLEIGICIATRNPLHCRDARDAFRIARKHRDKAKEVEKKLKDAEEQFNKGVSDLGRMVTILHTEQKAVVGIAMAEIRSSGDTLRKLKDINAPASAYAAAVDAQNVSNFTCPLEGIPQGGTGSCGGSRASQEDRAKLMQSSANATRTLFTAKASVLRGGASINQRFVPMSDYLYGLQGNEGAHGFTIDVMAGVGDRFTRDPTNYRVPTKVGGSSQGLLGVTWRHGVGGSALNTDAYSDDSAGRHNPGRAHEQGEKHDKFKGCEDCFVSFKSGTTGSDFNQPTSYGAVNQDLRWNSNGQKPWEITSSGQIDVKLGPVGDVKLNMVARDKGYAVSKGKAYFHQLGDWRVAPNLFDPFWRAKLHRFDDRTELNKAAALSGDPSVGLQGPVEGK